MSVSDIVVDGELPQAIRDRLDAWAGCVAGALDEADYLRKIRAAGFEAVEVLSRDYVTTGQIDEEEAQLLLVGADGQVTEGRRPKRCWSRPAFHSRTSPKKLPASRSRLTNQRELTARRRVSIEADQFKTGILFYYSF
jgi:hypothetical protein